MAPLLRNTVLVYVCLCVFAAVTLSFPIGKVPEGHTLQTNVDKLRKTEPETLVTEEGPEPKGPTQVVGANLMPRIAFAVSGQNSSQ